MVANNFRVEQMKLFRRPMWLISIGTLVGMLLISYLVAWATVGEWFGESSAETIASLSDVLQWPGGLFASLRLVAANSFGGMMVIILVGMITAQEYTHRTMQQWLMRGTPRLTLMAVKFVNLMLAACALISITLLVGGVLSAVAGLSLNGAVGVADVEWVELGAAWLRSIGGLFPYAAMTFMIAILTRSTVAAIGVSFGYVFLLEPLLTGLLPLLHEGAARVAMWLPGGLVNALEQSASGFVQVNVEGATAPVIEMPGVGAAIAGLSLYTVIFLTVAFLHFRRQDLSG